MSSDGPGLRGMSGVSRIIGGNDARASASSRRSEGDAVGRLCALRGIGA